jgi:hypothetical protein
MPCSPASRESDERLLCALHLRDAGRPYPEIAETIGYKTASAVRGIISKVRAADRAAENG